MSHQKDHSTGTTVWIIAGPTASGKSQLALDLAAITGGSVINADSMQVYREIPILTAQPAANDRDAVPHLLYGFQSITQNYSSAQWAEKAVLAIDAALAQKQQPILVGGSGLYLRALIDGFSVIPAVPQAVRKTVTDLYDMLGPHGFHDSLKKIDPVAANRLHPTDRQRCIRAREVYESSGVTLSEWQARPKKNLAPQLHYRSVVLTPERGTLHAQINRRFMQMMQNGALDEVKAVHRLNPSHDLTGMHALGLGALRDYLDGRISLEAAITQAQSQSRQYAKRQMTWFRHQALPATLMLAEAATDGLAQAREHLSNGGHVVSPLVPV